MKKRILVSLAGVALLVGVIAGPAVAAPYGPDRYQVGTTTYTIAVLDTYIHTYVVTANPCDGSIAMTGSTPVDSGYYTTETVTGTLADGVITFSSTYAGPHDAGYTWSGSFPVEGGALAGDYTGTVTVASTASTSYRNHGEYVASMNGGADAAHSCIGMPMQPANEATAAGGPDVAAVQARLAANEARLIATLEAVVARIQANAKASAQAAAAIQKHVDKLTAGDSGLDRAAAAVGGAGGSASATKPTLPDKAKDHPGPGNHPGKP